VPKHNRSSSIHVTQRILQTFVKDFSIITSLLCELMKKNVEFVWTRRCQDAFDELKRRLMTGPILALPKNEGCFVLDIDASDCLGCHTVPKTDRSTCRSTCFEARPKASCITIQRESYCLCFKDVIESRKQIRNDAKGIAGHGFRP